MKTMKTLLVLGAVLGLGACNDANCFAGECLTGPQIPGSGSGPTVEEQRAYFAAVVTGGRAGTLHRFESRTDPTIRVGLRGTRTAADSLEVERVLDDLGGLTGRQFDIVQDPESEIAVHFIPPEQFPDVVPSASPDADGWVSVAHVGGPITQSTALVSTDLASGGDERRHVIREEVARALGIIHGSADQPESIFYSGRSTVTDFSPLDEFVIRTAYDPQLESGMTMTAIEDELGW